MSTKQDKATTERHARTLREILKRPENKTCADCKRNDPRWASWNLGVFLCIRCSGIHRSMGTHISKVKSVDLDVWTPEQMASVQKWGNRRANLYWEAHLRAGHVPPDHKMDSYIRSKYESRRWAREGAPPEDPSVLEADAPAPAAAAPPTQAAPLAQTPAPSHASRASVSSVNATRTTQPHQLLSTAVAASRSPAAAIAPPHAQQAPVQQQQQPQSAAVDLFSLDFHAPTSSTPQPTQQEQKKDVTAEIMSLFSAAPPAAPAQQNAFGAAGAGLFGAAPAQPQNQFGGLGVAASQANPWGGFGQPQQQQQVPQQQTSMIGNAGVGAWGASSGWNAAPAPPVQPNIWGAPAPASQQSLFATSDVWSTPASNTPATGAATQKNNDAFGDLWGGFK
ncbi:ArfGap-domain-containing protein [Polyporus arcularius HHB13444]|uniref:ArfGap-domain-containing protein n=1 Tax=Polyporus arcularius HHB13444 TaxID=1314778 RepID=A0A5C3PLW3_9APHY|nr:ArfGap-domain-containing protein [Polyporus arcularius HHB13444]